MLALDTATPAVTVALHDGSGVIAEASAADARRHAELLAPLMERVLRQAGATAADLTDVAVGTGPG
ncbi:MAG TPA: tRNA (adenosine(37)-N6)-threonylcarbamoyltransferase complex dimerization subunit type 1 TsaB, partial [Actinomycetales bacterium]|nr:tRNA (adenosine(37)-N6)-threonylcarbamoyltransferase complex dimerization subunit type 1 TsaB [Actinomycetales bacterium]